MDQCDRFVLGTVILGTGSKDSVIFGKGRTQRITAFVKDMDVLQHRESAGNEIEVVIVGNHSVGVDFDEVIPLFGHNRHLIIGQHGCAGDARRFHRLTIHKSGNGVGSRRGAIIADLGKQIVCRNVQPGFLNGCFYAYRSAVIVGAVANDLVPHVVSSGIRSRGDLAVPTVGRSGRAVGAKCISHSTALGNACCNQFLCKSRVDRINRYGFFTHTCGVGKSGYGHGGNAAGNRFSALGTCDGVEIILALGQTLGNVQRILGFTIQHTGIVFVGVIALIPLIYGCAAVGNADCEYKRFDDLAFFYALIRELVCNADGGNLFPNRCHGCISCYRDNVADSVFRAANFPRLEFVSVGRGKSAFRKRISFACIYSLGSHFTASVASVKGNGIFSRLFTNSISIPALCYLVGVGHKAGWVNTEHSSGNGRAAIP